MPLKGLKISEAQDLPSEFHDRVGNTQIALRIECEMILKDCTTDMDNTVVTNDVSQNLFFLLIGDLFKVSQWI